MFDFAITTVQNFRGKNLFRGKIVLTVIMVLRIYKKMFNTSHIFILELKCVQPCLHIFLLKSSYYNDHEKNTINNLNFIKKPDSCKPSDWFSEEFHTNHIFQCNIDEKKLPELSIILLNIKR